ncbi:MAG: hypothetical protein ACOYJD_07885 [Christensenellales bacterium]
MGKKYKGLNSLIKSEPEAAKYYAELPDYVKDSISERGDNVNSFESLKDYAENLLRGDI